MDLQIMQKCLHKSRKKIEINPSRGRLLGKLHFRFCVRRQKSCKSCCRSQEIWAGRCLSLPFLWQCRKSKLSAEYISNLDVCVCKCVTPVTFVQVLTLRLWTIFSIKTGGECGQQMAKCLSVSKCRQRNPKCPNECVGRTPALCYLHSKVAEAKNTHRYVQNTDSVSMKHKYG